MRISEARASSRRKTRRTHSAKLRTSHSPVGGATRVKSKWRFLLAAMVLFIIPLCQTQLVKEFSAQTVQTAQASAPPTKTVAINLDGDLKANITAERRDEIWKGEHADQTEWFAGNAGESVLNMSYDFSNPENPVATCDLQFANANGNRPFAFMSSLNGAFPKLYLNETNDIVVHFDIKLDRFASNWYSWLRTSVVVALQSDTSSDRAYFEQDIKDNFWAQLALPIRGNEVTEICYTNLNLGNWVHLDVPFNDFVNTNAPPMAKTMMEHPESTFIESVYLVNECIGSGRVSYSLANWWITVEQPANPAIEASVS